ncbi:penicillin-binding protein [Leadbettera azotonutricia]|uniref:Penicillin-binding protein n=1 Tax=Leadbettera azotonutricia (strain ATCC BAA-888 / DSM 13862 / ZAS-9) TaxID=545695 RepID=F5Y6U5_LEAAZ|nr:penicillin-binding protein [Leadbettera azotonutricia]AEF83143.1 penicillin-binding protein [Leadbettera azotonutricia ZAS-9]
MSEQNRFSGKRRLVFFIVLGALALCVLGRYAYLMLGKEEEGGGARTAINAGRGPILDRNGRLLAFETRLGNITLWRPEMKNSAELSTELAPLLETSPVDIRERIENSPSDFVYLKKRVEGSTLTLIEDAIAEKKLQGVGIEPIVGRIYPERNLAAQIIGFTGDEGMGLEGIEFAFENELAPSTGGTRRSGNQVFLTIDINVQHILESIAGQIMKDSRAESVMFLAMDPRSGDILGSASLPGFDPNDFRNSGENTRRNNPATWPYEPGSVFKVFSLSALMDSGAISGNTIFTCNGHYERVSSRGERTIIRCLAAHGRVSARDIIVYSCNTGAAYAADRIGTDPFYALLKDYGFGARTGIGLPGETAGLLRSTERWSDRTKPTIAMGQEIGVSALQMLQAASAVANDGIMKPPRIVSRIVSADGKISREYPSGESRRVLKAETARAMRSYMTDVTSSIGTGWRANVEDLSLAVKTGTAEIIDPQTGSYSTTDFIASCVALLPAEAPSLILYLVIVKPQGEILGGRIAAPQIREAAEALINYLGIPRGRNPQIAHSGAVSIPAVPYPAVNETVPDFTGISKRQLLPLLLRDDLTFQISGDGWVARQSPAPGTPLAADTVIVLEFE